MSPQEQFDTIVLYQKVFGTEDGKKLLDHLTKMHVTRSSFSENVNVTNFKEGERNVVLQIMVYVNMDAKIFLEKVEQNAKKKHNVI